MHLPLTDRLACPRCGPGFGLILLADRIQNRRVLDGYLGCPNCREKYPVVDGFADLRPPPRPPLGQGGPPRELPGPDPEQTTRIAALLGVAAGPGTLLLAGWAAEHGAALGSLVQGVEIVAMGAHLRSWPEQEGVSRMIAGPGLPFFTGTLRAAALGGPDASGLVAEAARAVARLGRVVLMPGGPEARSALEAHGLRAVFADANAAVGQKTS